jgi:hypothetical protein
MRYLKLFEEFRESKGKLPLKEIDIEEFKKLLRENCHDFISLVKNLDYNFNEKRNFLFRKFKESHGDFIYSYPSQSEHVRIAPWSGWGNYHNLMVSNLESWKDYPRRNKSLICAGIKRAIGHEGSQLYLIIPYDKTKIGVCPKYEFWESFKTYTEDRIYLPNWCKRIINIVETENDIKLGGESWEEILPYLDKKYARYKFKHLIKLPWYNELVVNKTLLQNLNEYLSPKSNGFVLKTFKDLHPLLLSSDHECWFEGECIMISYEDLLNWSKDELKSIFG